MSIADPRYPALAARIDQLEQLLRTNPLRAASVSRGTTEFRDQSQLLITDSNMRVVGTAYVGGRLEGEGTFSWSGPAFLDGPVEVTATLDVLAQTRLRGATTIEEVTRLLSELIVEGKITSGNVRVEGGKIYIGNVVLDPSVNGGSLKFPGGPEVYANGSTLALYSVPIGAYIEIGAVELKVRGPGIRGFTVDAQGIRFDGVPFRSSADGVVAWYGEDADGYLVKVSPAAGGPIGSLVWPFPPSMVTSEYGPRESPGDGASTFHEGLDFGAAEGTDIPSAGSGVVELAKYDGGYGNSVVINHGGQLKTRYAHMLAAPAVTVGQVVAARQTLGAVGQTGISFGPHLHFEVEVNGVKVNPRSKLPAA